MRFNKALAFAALLLSAWGICRGQEPDVEHFESLIRTGDYTAAQSELASYVAANPSSWRAFYQLGYVQFRLQLISASLNSLCKSLVLNPKFPESHKILAYDLNILGRQDLALHELDVAIKQDPASSESYYERGRIFYERGAYLRAIQQFEKSKALNPNFVRVYHNLGLAYSAVRENPKAVANFEEGLKLNSQLQHPSAWPLIDYATFLNMQEDFAASRDLLLHSIEIEDKYDAAYYELSKAYRGLGRTADAIAALRHASTLNPRRADYHYVLARLLTQSHQPDKAKIELSLFQQKQIR